MSASRIALLSEDVRLQVNCRLRNGEPDDAVAAWLNTLPDAQAALGVESRESTVKEEDVSNWQQDGYRDWLAQHEAMTEVRRVVAEAKELSQAADGALTDNLAIWTAGRYAIATRRLALDNGNGAVDWNLLRAVCHDLVDLRRGDHSAAWLRIERERLEMERAEQKDDLEKRFWEWAMEHKEDVREKICNIPKMTAEEKENRIREILGMGPVEDSTDESDDDYSI